MSLDAHGPQGRGHYSRVKRKEARAEAGSCTNKCDSMQTKEEEVEGAASLLLRRGGSMTALPPSSAHAHAHAAHVQGGVGGGGHGAGSLLALQQQQDVDAAGICSNAAGDHTTGLDYPSVPTSSSGGSNKRKRRPAGTPDPGAEVVALSPKTLMESDRYVCEICNQGFQRDQNLQMHRRRHKVPWKLLKRPSLGTHKRVYVCPERSCLHHDPAHALGDLVGIKKHYRRKHCSEKQWKCDKCSKGYAVQSDYKAHLKTCGTRGHCCDCGRVFSRVESFIEHQDTCSDVKHKNMQSEGGSDRKTSRFGGHPHHTHGKSDESPSQSSDTTQAIPVAHSGMSETTASRSGDSTRFVINDPSALRRLEQSSPAMHAVNMPTWLTDQRRSHNELELLPSTHHHQHHQHQHHQQSTLADHSFSAMKEFRRENSSSQAVSGSRSSTHVLRSSSLNSRSADIASCTDPTSNTPQTQPVADDAPTAPPSLHLSIGPSSGEIGTSGSPFLIESPSSMLDTKPRLNSRERDLIALTHQQAQMQARGGNSNVTSLGKDLALSFPGIVGSYQPGQGNSLKPEDHRGRSAIPLTDFLIQAAKRLGPPLSDDSPDSSSRDNPPKKQMKFHTELGRSTNYGAGIGSIFHGDQRGVLQESDSSELRTPRRGSTYTFQHSPGVGPQLEPATSTVTRSHAATDQSRDAATPASELFVGSRGSVGPEAAHRQKEMGCPEAAASQPTDQIRTDMMSTAWCDIAAARRTREQARQESHEAQKEIARADHLKREAREQLQLASQDRAYAEHAREIAKREMDLAQVELANAKRLREQAQAELDRAQSLKLERAAELSLCHSCSKMFTNDQYNSNRMQQLLIPAVAHMRAPHTLQITELQQSADSCHPGPGDHSFEARNDEEQDTRDQPASRIFFAHQQHQQSSSSTLKGWSSDHVSRWPGITSSGMAVATTQDRAISPHGDQYDQSIGNQSSTLVTPTVTSEAQLRNYSTTPQQLDLN